MAEATTPLTQRAYDRLLAAILRGELEPGTRLVVTDLAEWLDMSRTPVRDALKRLSVTRVVATSGSGYQVVEPTPRELRDLVDLLLLLEPQAAGEASEAHPEVREEVSRQLTDADHHDDGGHAFHVVLGAAAANRYVSEAVGVLNERLATARVAIAVPCRDSDDHAVLVDAIGAGKPDRARAASSSHLMALRAEIYGALR